MYAGLITEDDVDYATTFPEIVWADLRGEATEEQQAELYDNPVGWLRALRSIKRQMHASISEGRTHVRANLGDDEASRHARSEQYASRARKFHVISKAEERRQYVIRLIGDEGLTLHCLGAIVDDIARAQEAIEGQDPAAAMETLDKLARSIIGSVANLGEGVPA